MELIIKLWTMWGYCIMFSEYNNGFSYSHSRSYYHCWDRGKISWEIKSKNKWDSEKKIRSAFISCCNCYKILNKSWVYNKPLLSKCII